MKVSELVSYLKAVHEEAGDLPIVIQVENAFAHEALTPEVIDGARCWIKSGDNEYLHRIKAVVLR